MLVKSRGLPSDSTCILKAEHGKLILKDANLVFYLSVYTLLNTLQTSDYDVFFLFLCRFSFISEVIQKVQRHQDLIKVTCCEIDNIYQATCNNAVNMRSN